jgi:hypothetical protein
MGAIPDGAKQRLFPGGLGPVYNCDGHDLAHLGNPARPALGDGEALAEKLWKAGGADVVEIVAMG